MAEDDSQQKTLIGIIPIETLNLEIGWQKLDANIKSGYRMMV